METIIILLVFLVIAGLTAIGIFILFNNRKDSLRQSSSIEMLIKNIEALRTAQDSIKDTVYKSLQSGQENVSKSLQFNLENMNKLQKQLGELQEASRKIEMMGSDVNKLSEILKSPKIRGLIGEKSLESLLGNVLPAGTFNLQYEFSDGKKVDALIKLPNYSVPVDAKFPLPNFEKLAAADNEDEKAKFRREFTRDIVAHIDKIAASYIKPTEGTVDFAMMFIPAENVYYETITRQAKDTLDITEYSLSKKVIPVSPNIFYAYLMTIVMGLHGLEIEKQAAQIRQRLNELRGKFGDFDTNWDLLGKHLRNASNQYNEAQSKLDKFNFELDQIGREQLE